MLSTLVSAANAAQTGLYYAIYGSYKTGFILVTFLKTLFGYLSIIWKNLVTILAIFGESVTIFFQDIFQYFQNILNFMLTSAEVLTKNTVAILAAIYIVITKIVLAIASFYNAFVTTLWNFILSIEQLFGITKKFIVLLGSGIWFAVTLVPLLIFYFLKLSVTLIQKLFLEACQSIYHSILSLITGIKNMVLFTIDVPIESLFGLLIALSLVYIFVQFYVLISTNLTQVWGKLRSILIRLKTRLFTTIQQHLQNRQPMIYRRQVRENQNQETPQRANVTLGRPEARPTIRNGLETRQRRQNQYQTPKMEKNSLNLEITEDKYCVICQERNKCILLLPCRHVCLCSECIRELMYYNNVCPVCRSDIESTMKIFV